jgi:hypothetical protein
MDKPYLYEVKLTEQELLRLDGVSSFEVQRIIDTAKEERRIQDFYKVPANIAAMIVKILRTAKVVGKLSYYPMSIQDCPACGRNDGYNPLRRNKYARAFGNRFCTKHIGEPDYKSPKYFEGYDLNRGFITFNDRFYTGYCSACKSIIEPILAVELVKIEYEHPVLSTGNFWLDMTTRFKYYDRRKCKKCGWEGGENLMGLLPAMMGGSYPGICPQCKSEQRPFGEQIFDTAKGFVLVPVKQD